MNIETITQIILESCLSLESFPRSIDSAGAMLLARLGQLLDCEFGIGHDGVDLLLCTSSVRSWPQLASELANAGTGTHRTHRRNTIGRHLDADDDRNEETDDLITKGQRAIRLPTRNVHTHRARCAHAQGPRCVGHTKKKEISAGWCVHLVVRVHILPAVRTFSRPCAHFAGRVHFCKAVRTFSRPCAHFAGRVHILPAVWMFTFSPNVHVLNVRTVTYYRLSYNCDLAGKG